MITADELTMLAVRKRICIILENYEVSMASFAAEAGLRYPQIQQMLKGSQAVSGELVAAVLQRFREVNPHWLSFGKGPMLKGGGSTCLKEADLLQLLQLQERRNEQLRAIIAEQQLLLTRLEKEHSQLLKALMEQGGWSPAVSHTTKDVLKSNT